MNTAKGPGMSEPLRHRLRHVLDRGALQVHPAVRPWLWFGVLWCSGILGVTLLVWPFRILFAWARYCQST